MCQENTITATRNQQTYQKNGDVGNILLLTGTSIITGCMLNQWPNKDHFDDNWLSNGFCVSNSDTFWWNSHSLSFYADTVLAIAIGLLYKKRISSGQDFSPVQMSLLSGAIMAVFGHGAGHMYLGMNPTGMDLRIRLDHLAASFASLIVNILGFASIFKGTMPLASTRRLLMAAIVATIGFTFFDIEPKLNFVYAQAAIYIASALNMLVLPQSDKGCAAYMLFPYFQLPVLAVGVIESTGCEAILEKIGGHMIFDVTIAIAVILIDLISTRLERSSKTSNVEGKKKL